jgi:hypothetical protein
MNRSYAVLWSGADGCGSGRLEPLPDRLELCGRERVSIPYTDLAGTSIGRRNGERLHGLPVLVLHRHGGAPPIRIASMEGAGALHELAQHLARAGRIVAA